jgi:hypothetical protein
MQPVLSARASDAVEMAASCVDSPSRFRLAVVDVEALGGHEEARRIGQQLGMDLRLSGRIALVLATCQTNAQLEAKAKWAGFAQVRSCTSLNFLAAIFPKAFKTHGQANVLDMRALHAIEHMFFASSLPGHKYSGAQP